MHYMKKMFILLLLPLLLADCRNKKTILADDDEIDVETFIDFFDEVKLPYQVSDTTLTRKVSDSSVIAYKIFTQFVPDSVMLRQFGKTAKPRIYPLGKASVKKNETYLFVKMISASKKAVYIFAFDKDNQFIAAMPMLALDKSAATSQTSVMDTKYSITTITRSKSADGLATESKNVYVLNADAAVFTLILTDAGQTGTPEDIINPIDTFPKKHKFAGDYFKDKKNFISVRDGRNDREVLFFAHFEKMDGECVGELKGNAQLNGAKTAVYRATGNPCVLEFTFGSNAVSMKELEACGSYRDINCFFEGSYPRKKEPKPKKATKKT
jgi:hypothetical protein